MSHLAVAALVLTVARIASATTAGDLCPANANPCTVSSAWTVTPGSVLDFGTRQLDVTSSGSITVPSGQLTILAGSVRLESHARLLGGQTADGTGANIKIMTSGDVRVETGANGDARIDISANIAPGELDIISAGSIVVLGQIHVDALTDNGDGGFINTSSDADTTISGTVSAQGGTLGFGGEITVQAGGSASTTGTVRADGGDGGDIEIDALNGDVTGGGALNASSNGTYGDGGEIDMTGSRNLTLSGDIALGATGNSIDGGGEGGDAVLEATSGSMTVSGTVDNHGALPDGDGGEADMTAGVDYTQAGDVTGYDGGADGCGGFFDGEIGRTFNLLGMIDESGGFCGGDILIDADTVTLGSASQLSSDGGDIGGTVSINAQTITAAGRMGASGTSTGASGGFVQLSGCTLSIPSGAIVRTDGSASCTCAQSGADVAECGTGGYCLGGVCIAGDSTHLACTSSSQCAPGRVCQAKAGENLFQASGQLTIGGQVQSRPLGKNRFEYRDPAKPPITLGSAVVQPTRDCAPAPGCLTPDLPACAAVGVCGNGIREAGEECDDGNTAACDGCSPTCRVERCGNGTIECGEECDDGIANGAPGDPCDASCHVVQAANVVFVPGAHHGRTGCGLEWAIQNTATGGFPDTTQSCVDGDPACDADGASDGVCTFHVSACLNVTDARLPQCAPRDMSYVKVRRPSPVKPKDAVEAANAQQLVTALEGLGITVRAGDAVLQAGSPDATSDHCTQTFVQRVPHPDAVAGRRLLAASAKDVNGVRAGNRAALKCLPNTAVCGNGVTEIGEQCDDGNTVDCDGCSAACRLERCGDGIVECGEQCDDGPNNGTPGDPCTATCTAAPPADRIPGGSGSGECAAEVALASGQLVTLRSGLPSTRQACVDGDPSCDFDPTPGNCRLHVWFCYGGDDARLSCAASSITSVSLVRPSPTQTGFPAAARAAIEAALGQVTFPVGPGEVCSRRVDLDVPAGRAKLLVKTQALTAEGFRDRDSLKLACVPAGTTLRRR